MAIVNVLRLFAASLFLHVYHASAQLSRAGWIATADSYESINPPSYAIDGNSSTFWHSEYSPALLSLPHNITLNMLKTYNVYSVSYLPRQDGNSNGNIGQHQILLSTDGVHFTAPLVIGTWVDDNTQKTSTFITTPAQYVRLIGLTEAGNRGPWSSAAEINVFAAATYTAPAAGLGQWGPTVDFPLVPAAAAMQENGEVLGWSSYQDDNFESSPGGITQTFIYTPTGSTVSERTITNTDHDMFCPGLCIDTMGRTTVTGGNDADKTSIYSPLTNAWVAGGGMNIARGYQSMATLSDGRIFVIGGSWSGELGGKNGEIFNTTTNAWTLLPGCLVAPMLTDDSQGVYRQDNHGWLFGWKNGYIFQAGPSKAMNWYSTTGTGGQVGAGVRGTDADAMNGNAIMYDAVAGKILTVGGAPDYQDNNATSNANLITIGTPGQAVTVQSLQPMSFTRAFHESVVLPDGTVFVTGGQPYPVPFTDSGWVAIPELWNPTTLKFTQLNPMAIPRTYHSWALLLPDATVINGGGGLCGAGCATNHFDAQIFRPPYLFTSSGALATRPVINSVSSTSVPVGGKFTINMNSAVTSFSLIRFGSNTHTVNTDQRRIPLTTTASGNTYTATLPTDPGVALPGYYMLYGINSAGVPSISTTILITI